EVGAPTELGRGSGQDGAHGLRRATVLSDDFSNIAFGDLQLDERVVVAFDLRHLDAIGVVHQCLRYGRYQFLESHVSVKLRVAGASSCAESYWKLQPDELWRNAATEWVRLARGCFGGGRLPLEQPP